MKKVIFLMSIISLSSVTAFADQCAWVTKAQAEEAYMILAETSEVKMLCESCGETEAKSLELKGLEIREAKSSGMYEVVLNGKALDIAYVYADGVNLGMMAGCSVNGASEIID